MDLIGEEDIELVFAESNSKTIKEIVKPVEKAMELFQKNISTLSYLPDVGRVTLRTQTLQTMMDVLLDHIKDIKEEDVLDIAGERVGSEFAEDIFIFFQKIRKLPRSVKVLVKVANEFDSIAGWGKFKAEFQEGKIITKIQNNFLDRDRTEHRYCPFMNGYIRGFLWHALKLQYRLFEKKVIRPSGKPLTVARSEVQCETSVCKVISYLKDEELINAFDNIYKAKFAAQEANLKAASVHLRTSLENAFKEKIGIDIDSQTSVLKVIKAFKEKNIKLRYRLIQELYGSTSADLHGSKITSKTEFDKFYDGWMGELKKLELLRIGEKDLKEIRDEVEKT